MVFWKPPLPVRDEDFATENLCVINDFLRVRGERKTMPLELFYRCRVVVLVMYHCLMCGALCLFWFFTKKDVLRTFVNI